VSDLFTQLDGTTPLDTAGQVGLIPTWVATRVELNEVEQENVAEAQLWAFGRSWSVEEFDQPWLKGLHRRMFNKVWRWAGHYRKSDTNFGLPWPQITLAAENLLRDLSRQTSDIDRLPWPAEELAVRFHHRLVQIHPFPNGNGRHGRLAADLVIEALGGSRFSWGAGVPLADPGPARSEYLGALREADGNANYAPLLEFAKR
jgi:Fic-DOC domain mobile mystery protein B